MRIFSRYEKNDIPRWGYIMFFPLILGYFLLLGILFIVYSIVGIVFNWVAWFGRKFC